MPEERKKRMQISDDHWCPWTRKNIIHQHRPPNSKMHGYLTQFQPRQNPQGSSGYYILKTNWEKKWKNPQHSTNYPLAHHGQKNATSYRLPLRNRDRPQWLPKRLHCWIFNLVQQKVTQSGPNWSQQQHRRPRKIQRKGLLSPLNRKSGVRTLQSTRNRLHHDQQIPRSQR